MEKLLGRAKQMLASCTKQAAAKLPCVAPFSFQNKGCLADKDSLLHGTQHICSGILDQRKPLLRQYLSVILTKGKKTFLLGLRSGTRNTPVLICIASRLAGHLLSYCLETGSPESTFHI